MCGGMKSENVDIPLGLQFRSEGGHQQGIPATTPCVTRLTNWELLGYFVEIRAFGGGIMGLLFWLRLLCSESMVRLDQDKKGSFC